MTILLQMTNLRNLTVNFEDGLNRSVWFVEQSKTNSYSNITNVIRMEYLDHIVNNTQKIKYCHCHHYKLPGNIVTVSQRLHWTANICMELFDIITILTFSHRAKVNYFPQFLKTLRINFIVSKFKNESFDLIEDICFIDHSVGDYMEYRQVALGNHLDISHTVYWTQPRIVVIDYSRSRGLIYKVW